MTASKIKKENIVQYAAIGLALLFCLFSLIFFSIRAEKNKAFMSLLSIAYVFCPALAQKLFKLRIQNTLYVFIIFYTVCPLLGFSYKLYHILHWWDDIMHAFAGIIFAMLGAYIPKMMSKDGKADLNMCVFCAFFFSVAIAALWELVEFTVDANFGTDMQKDTFLNSVRPSYLLSSLLGAPTGEFERIESIQILVNGKLIDGYVDLGLLDSMTDVIVETCGAAIYTIIFRIANGKYFTFEKILDEEELALEAAPVQENAAVQIKEVAATSVDAPPQPPNE